MSANTANIIVCVGVALLGAALAYSFASSNSRQRRHPPGPYGYPFIGNIRVPADPAWKTYRQWSDVYESDIVRINVLGTNIVVTNTLQASSDLLDKKSAIYSDRPSYGMTMMTELCGFGWSIGLMRYNAFWRDARKAYHRELHPQAVQRFRPIVVRSSYELLRNLLRAPEKFNEHLRHAMGRELLYSAYGIDVQEKDDPIIATAEHGLESAVAAMNIGQFLVDLIPALKYVPEWFPGAGFQRQAKIWKASLDSMLHVPFNAAKNLLAAGRLPDDCVAKALLTDTVPNAVDPAYMEDVVRAALGTMYAAGMDTTFSALQSFFLAMVLYPKFQQKAQAFIDRACDGRLPDFSDYHSLPYVHAILKEILRWNPVIPLNLVHVSTEDDVYDGYDIPKGTFVLSNTWYINLASVSAWHDAYHFARAILHDPAVYNAPDTFNPERFLRTNASGELELDPAVRDPNEATFGFGRRICPGRFLAYEALWLAVASVLAAFSIAKAKDEHGADVTPDAEYEYGFMIFPKPFGCRIVPRSSECESLVGATAESE
ncbi:uncharacterized protein PHACADRAFT_214509 [Phanerochaete carnosa HHB-10118-sp]|uniref:Cytochrome P450 n=1 Tax=Phanerochaete carnosa (strain HHB-10118-sp) TaxID=650164 RepID=K5VQS5_PHACS|nr:uncharacterized protein PHACADRAFT_214509 [Phanerochaete carnosa HHB-10118-sp]EKM49100.1 hypothetical protein PHACADRAFT_214509 [Phanerochaete carnosa HHB-10118-sp]